MAVFSVDFDFIGHDDVMEKLRHCVTDNIEIVVKGFGFGVYVWHVAVAFKSDQTGFVPQFGSVVDNARCAVHRAGRLLKGSATLKGRSYS